MVAETLYATTHITGAAGTPNNALGAPDASWTTNTGATSWTSRWALGNPTAALNGTTSTLRAYVRKEAGQSGTPSAVLEFWQNGSLVQAASSVGVTSTTGQWITLTVTNSGVTQPNDAEVTLAVTAAGGNPSTRTSVQVDAFEWIVDVSSGPEILTRTATAGLALGGLASLPAGVADLLAAHFAHWDFSDSASLVTFGTEIVGIADQTGNGYQLDSTGVGPQTGTLNGLGAADYGGFQGLYSSSLPPTEQPLTIWAAFKLTTTTGVQAIIGHASAALKVNGDYLITDNNLWTLDSDVPADTDTHVIIATFDGMDSSIYIDGALAVSGDVGDSGISELSLGYDAVTFGNYLVGLIGESGVYEGVFDATQRGLIEDYLTAKWVGSPSGEVRTASAGVTLGGTATAVATQTRTASGGVSLGGTAAQVEREITTATAGVTLGGTAVQGAPPSSTGWWSQWPSTWSAGATELTHTATGGITLGGTAPREIRATRTAATGPVLGGTATAFVRLTTTATGGVAISGDAVRLAQITRTATAGVAIGGLGNQATAISRTATAGVNIGGGGVQIARFVLTASAGISLSGTSTQVSRMSRTAAGGVTLGGAAAQIARLARTATLGVTLGGNAPRQIRATRAATLGLTLGATASSLASFARTAAGGVVLGGEGATIGSLARTASANITIAADMPTYARLDRTASAGPALGGAVGNIVIITTTATGGVSLSGEGSLAGGALTRTASAGVTLAASAQVAGAAQTRTASAGVTLSGAGASTPKHMLTGSGALSLGGVATAAGLIARSATLNISLVGAAQADAAGGSITRLADGRFSISGMAQTTVRVIVTASATVNLSAGAVAVGRVARTATAGVSIAGASDGVGRLHRTASAGFTLSSGALGVASGGVNARTAEGGVVLDGSAEWVQPIPVLTAVGGITLVGKGSVGNLPDVPTRRTLTFLTPSTTMTIADVSRTMTFVEHPRTLVFTGVERTLIYLTDTNTFEWSDE